MALSLCCSVLHTSHLERLPWWDMLIGCWLCLFSAVYLFPMVDMKCWGWRTADPSCGGERRALARPFFLLHFLPLLPMLSVAPSSHSPLLTWRHCWRAWEMFWPRSISLYSSTLDDQDKQLNHCHFFSCCFHLTWAGNLTVTHILFTLYICDVYVMCWHIKTPAAKLVHVC